MADFDPAEPALLHDRVSGKMIPWTGERGDDFRRHAKSQAGGIVAWDGMLLDGWGNPLGG